tara:strand:- start:404 stop:643 length:240 start_codon:yes stop_codon:yes gene_type:complete
MDNTRLDKLEKEVAELRTKIGSKEEKFKKEKKPRAPSAYNEFVKKCLADEKSKMGENYDHKKAFKNAAEEWSKNKGKSS